MSSSKLLTNLWKLKILDTINQSIDHCGSIKMKRCFRKCCFNQWITKNGRKINFLNSFIVKRDFVNIFWSGKIKFFMTFVISSCYKQHFRCLASIIRSGFVYGIWLKTTETYPILKGLTFQEYSIKNYFDFAKKIL